MRRLAEEVPKPRRVEREAFLLPRRFSTCMASATALPGRRRREFRVDRQVGRRAVRGLREVQSIAVTLLTMGMGIVEPRGARGGGWKQAMSLT